jgi:hypothetical protein
MSFAVLRYALLCRKPGLWFGWWQFSRCGHSDDQRSAGAAESFVRLQFGHALRCPLRGQTESRRNSVHHHPAAHILLDKVLRRAQDKIMAAARLQKSFVHGFVRAQLHINS